MENENKTELKQALNKVTIIGELQEKKLEIKDNKDKEKYIGGELVVATSDTASYKIHIFAKQKII
mgnify:FL=1